MKTQFMVNWGFILNFIIIVINGKISNKIIGGEPAHIRNHNYQVSIQINNIHICGGAIIGKNHVLTTASCVSSEISNNFHATYANMKILSGTSNLLQDGPFDSRMLNNVNYIIHHEQYNTLHFFHNDIALLKTVKPLYFESVRGKVHVSLSQKIISESYITGWGENLAGHVTQHLQHLHTKLFGSRKCQVWYRYRIKLNPAQYCVLPIKSPTVQFTWGNGGSAVMRVQKMSGILSIINMNPIIPSIYTYTYYYYDWINKYTIV